VVLHLSVCMYKHLCSVYSKTQYSDFTANFSSSFGKILTETMYQAYYFACKFRLQEESGNFTIPPKACVYLPCLKRRSSDITKFASHWLQCNFPRSGLFWQLNHLLVLENANPLNLSGSYINSRPGNDNSNGNSLCASNFPLNFYSCS